MISQKIQSKCSHVLKGSKGFTLIETLIVLSVATLMLSFSIITINTFTVYMEKKMFIDQIQTDLYYAHAVAVGRKETLTVRFSPSGQRYEVVLRSKGKTIIEKRLPSSIYIESSNLPSFTITPDGTVSNFGKVTFRQNDRVFELNFSIGRGRFYIQE